MRILSIPAVAGLVFACLARVRRARSEWRSASALARLMDMDRGITAPLRSARMVITTIILTHARRMATTVLTGSLEAFSSAPVRGSEADFTGIADFMVADSTDVDMAAAGFTDLVFTD